MKKLAFIINPISGGKSKKNIPMLIHSIIDKSRFEVSIIFTERALHGFEIAKDLVAKKFDKVIAVGGDGTVNEIGKALLHSNTALGIIPLGSGNGLARHLNIPMNTGKALELINNSKTIKMDSAALNEQPFFCTSGVGFDAYIGQEFAKLESRGFKSYVKSVLKGFISYKSRRYRIHSADGEIKTNAFLITVGNTSQYGNNAYICPHADVQDGLLDVTIIQPFPKIYALDLGRRIFTKSMEKSRYSTLFQTTSLEIERDIEGPVHLDGEPLIMGKKLNFTISPLSLNVIVGN